MNQNKSFVSLCILAYKRPEQLVDCISTISRTAQYPHEIIVNLDADNEDRNRDYLYRLFRDRKISKLIFSNGKNRGVGRSFANCVGMAEGEYICKVDTDLTFKDGWLKKGVEILQNNPDIGATSFFNYNHYDPNDKRFEITAERKECYIVNDFVSSIYLFNRDKLTLNDKWKEDDGFHSTIQNADKKLAITKDDYVNNSGFGVGNSVYVVGTMDNPRKAEVYNEPVIYG